MKDHFNGTMETKPKLKAIMGEEQMAHIAKFWAWKASKNREGGGGNPLKVYGVKQMSILFKLPY